MFNRFGKSLIISLVMVLGLAVGIAGAQDKKIRIGWTAWSDAEAVTKIARQLLEERMGYDVELVLSDIAIQYQGVAKGDLDVMLMSWLPATHSDYLDKVGGDVVNLGILYGNAVLAWVIPDYIPEDQLNSIADLKKSSVRDKLDGKIQGIDPGAGLMRLSKKTIDEYGLDYELVSSSGAAMTAALGRAVQRDEWIVVTGWTPHWKFAKWDLRILEDPQNTLGGAERIHAIARQGFYHDATDAALMLSRMHFPLEELQAVMAEAQNSDYETAVDNYIKNHPKRVNYWVTGNID